MAGTPRDKAKTAALKRALQRGDFSSARKLVASHGAAPRRGAGKNSRTQPAAAASVSLAEACGTGESNFDGCKLTLVRRAVEDCLRGQLSVQRECVRVLRGARQRFDELEASPALCHAADAAAEDILFVTAETAGASDPVVFMVGVMFLQSGRLMIEQYFARDERQEKGVLKALASRYGAAAVVATFGARKKAVTKALFARCRLHGVDLLSDAWEAPQRQSGRQGPVHLDLRKECRDRWGRGGRNLESVERALMRRPRDVKLPRGGVAEAYRRFLATGDAAGVGDILRHNALDLVAMAAVLCRLLTGCDPEQEDV